METDSFPLIPAVAAAEIAGTSRLTDRARSLLEPGQPLTDYLAILMKSKLFKDAYSLLAVALRVREAVWWGGLCIRQSHGPIRASADATALRAALAWVLDPTPEARQRAATAGEAAGTDSACGCLALAAGEPPVPLTPLPNAAPRVRDADPSSLAAQLLRRAILLASVHGDPRVLGPYPEHFVKLGLGVASGEYSWKKLVTPLKVP